MCTLYGRYDQFTFLTGTFRSTSPSVSLTLSSNRFTDSIDYRLLSVSASLRY